MPGNVPTMAMLLISTGCSCSGHICSPVAASAFGRSVTFVNSICLSAAIVNSPVVNASFSMTTIATPSSMISVMTVSPAVTVMVALASSAASMRNALPSVYSAFPGSVIVVPVTGSACLSATSVTVFSSVLAVNVRLYVPAGYSLVPNTKFALSPAGSTRSVQLPLAVALYSYLIPSTATPSRVTDQIAALSGSCIIAIPSAGSHVMPGNVPTIAMLLMTNSFVTLAVTSSTFTSVPVVLVVRRVLVSLTVPPLKVSSAFTVRVMTSPAGMASPAVDNSDTRFAPDTSFDAKFKPSSTAATPSKERPSQTMSV